MHNANKNNKKDISAEEYLAHLLNDGDKEGDIDDSELHLPSWCDKDLLKRGQSYVSTYRFVLFSGMMSGLIVVLAIPSILKVLISTKQSSTAPMAYKRYVRTILHVLAWYEYPFEPGSKSWESIKMVRDKHLLSSQASIKLNTGLISQKDLALTQFGFIGFICLGAEKIGIIDPEFHEATVHLWRVIGYMLGIKDEYNLCTDNWVTTKQRLDIVMQEVFKPALDQTGKDFDEMTKALVDGLWPVNTMLTWNSAIFLTKQSCGCLSYEYFKSDNFGDDVSQRHTIYYKLNLYNRFLVSYMMYVTYTLYKFNWFRIYINFRIQVNQLLAYYFPYLAFYQYGFRWAYVRIFNKNKKDE